MMDSRPFATKACVLGTGLFFRLQLEQQYASVSYSVAEWNLGTGF